MTSDCIRKIKREGKKEIENKKNFNKIAPQDIELL